MRIMHESFIRGDEKISLTALLNGAHSTLTVNQWVREMITSSDVCTNAEQVISARFNARVTWLKNRGYNRIGGYEKTIQ